MKKQKRQADGADLEVVALGARDAQQTEQVVEEQRVVAGRGCEGAGEERRVGGGAHRQRELNVSQVTGALVVGQTTGGAAAEVAGRGAG